MSIDHLRPHWGFTRVPFTRELAPSMLFQSKGHAEAVARISWLVSGRALGIVTGEVGSGKSVAARVVVSQLDTSRHSVVYLANPAVGARGMYAEIVTALGGVPRCQKASLIAQAAPLLAQQEDELGAVSSSSSMRPTCSRRPSSRRYVSYSPPTWTAGPPSGACCSGSPHCADASASGPMRPSASVSRSATASRA